MSRPITKTGQVSLRVGEDIASLLGPMVNASEFIRRAILAHAGCRCPLCLGHGFVPMGIGEHFAELVASTPTPASEGQELRPPPPGSGG